VLESSQQKVEEMFDSLYLANILTPDVSMPIKMKTNPEKIQVLKQLLYFYTMHNGWCAFHRQDDRTLVGCGVGFIESMTVEGYVATHFLAEQPVSNCLQRRFENMLAINLQPDEDPIFQELEARMDSLSDKGMAGHMVVCRILMRNKGKSFVTVLNLSDDPQGLESEIVQELSQFTLQAKVSGFAHEFQECVTNAPYLGRIGSFKKEFYKLLNVERSPPYSNEEDESDFDYDEDEGNDQYEDEGNDQYEDEGDDQCKDEGDDQYEDEGNVQDESDDELHAEAKQALNEQLEQMRIDEESIYQYEHQHLGSSPLSRKSAFLHGHRVDHTASISLSQFTLPEQVIIIPEDSANIDIAGNLFSVKQEGILYWMQVKLWQKKITTSSVGEALKSIHPWYVLRATKLSRLAYWAWWQKNNPFSKIFIRVIVSFSGFSRAVKEEISRYNTNNPRRPVLLWQPTAEQIGNKLKANSHFATKVTKDNSTKGKIAQELLVIDSLQDYLARYEVNAKGMTDKVLTPPQFKAPQFKPVSKMPPVSFEKTFASLKVTPLAPPASVYLTTTTSATPTTAPPPTNPPVPPVPNPPVPNPPVPNPPVPSPPVPNPPVPNLPAQTYTNPASIQRLPLVTFKHFILPAYTQPNAKKQKKNTHYSGRLMLERFHFP
jgi:hypothetical protein